MHSLRRTITRRSRLIAGRNIIRSDARPVICCRKACGTGIATPFSVERQASIESSGPKKQREQGGEDAKKEWEQRRQNIEANDAASYPRIDEAVEVWRLKDVHSKWSHLKIEITETPIVVRVLLGQNKGRIWAIREAASKLIFLDIVEDGTKLQICQSLKRTGGTIEEFQANLKTMSRGDHVEYIGYPGRTAHGELSIYATALPKRLSPTLHVAPPALTDPGLRFRSRHVDLMINAKARNILRQRSAIINHIRSHFLDNDFLEVQTPILSDVAGGAVARPFATSSSVFGASRKLQLRIAPELWLKRLVVGGMERIFEIGVSFRNENADATHNPEFTTCEFYQAYAGLEELITRTESLLRSIPVMLREASQRDARIKLDIDEKALAVFEGTAPYACIDFIEGIEAATGKTLPNLDDEHSAEILLSIFDKQDIPRPSSLTTPSLLDHLSSHFLEPQCQSPTFLTNIPACLSPLSKSSIRSSDGQHVSHRVELFVLGKELVNAYEEENSPFVQRRKFEEQVRYRLIDEPLLDVEAETAKVVDGNYLRALEWGLPPTGGWGIGLDRLCMLMCGVDRISEVLTFGGLRGVGLGGKRTEPHQSRDDLSGSYQPQNVDMGCYDAPTLSLKPGEVQKCQGNARSVEEEERQGTEDK